MFGHNPVNTSEAAMTPAPTLQRQQRSLSAPYGNAREECEPIEDLFDTESEDALSLDNEGDNVDYSSLPPCYRDINFVKKNVDDDSLPGIRRLRSQSCIFSTSYAIANLLTAPIVPPQFAPVKTVTIPLKDESSLIRIAVSDNHKLSSRAVAAREVQGSIDDVEKRKRDLGIKVSHSGQRLAIRGLPESKLSLTTLAPQKTNQRLTTRVSPEPKQHLATRAHQNATRYLAAQEREEEMIAAAIGGTCGGMGALLTFAVAVNLVPVVGQVISGSLLVFICISSIFAGAVAGVNLLKDNTSNESVARSPAVLFPARPKAKKEVVKSQDNKFHAPFVVGCDGEVVTLPRRI